jgi:hypothetical protein
MLTLGSRVNTPAPRGGGFQLHRDARIEKQASSSD